MVPLHDDRYIETIIRNQKLYISIPALSTFPELIHGFTTRFGGVSTGEYASLNLNYNRNDDPNNVRKNFELLSLDLGVPLNNMVLSHQVHDKNVLKVESTHGGMGIVQERNYHRIDGLITHEADLMLITYYADCVPVYFYDPVKRVIALAHSGWKGTLLNIGAETLKALKDSYGCNPADIHVAFGPHIKSCCFEVDYDVADTFHKTFPWSKKFSSLREDSKWLFDLERIITYNLFDKGILHDKISGCPLCTKCHNDVFFSHRGSGGKTGTGAAFLMIRG